MSGTVWSVIPPLLLLALVLVTGAAGVDRALRARDGERLFWVGFTAFLGVLMTAAWAVAASPDYTPVAGWAVAAGSTAAAAWVVWRNRRRAVEQERNRTAVQVHGTTLRHRDVLSRWSAYELDPWLAAEYPRLQDVRSPETRDFIRALKTADQLRAGVRTPEDAAAYSQAVDRLAGCLEAAERAAGGGRAA
ncbi:MULTISPECIES: hypothetical protein [unclassified Arthrobacter]|uniref:hypothetical protein n=1 Tax=unclassified Arthrobacter TaxID=235627 RepID=UPI001D146415|nr:MULTISPECIES: hypothetical protein [unclassified Arthrobacter]MCC3275761.1 hypothetical protein [Arthrobacter sp. zg-Y20]MCC9177188.1 hypothetical protein [Arthrobacter sp. zg-Y750]MDK1315918.1 hypothetical protein [Arthrobacter sp. zg.Y20]MDK1326113.1 hypothetical protein [Arthrobacter sp. zg-Y1143]WIB06303.1 hypothetical protein QNO06_00680 [Arthrobacter sp. zg-Y20]